MSELIYPSDVIPEIDWESPLGIGGVHSACIFKSDTDLDIVDPSNQITFFSGISVLNYELDCSTATTTDAVSFGYNPLLTQSSGSFVFTIDIFAGDHSTHSTILSFTESSQRYFIFGYNRDRKTFFLSQRNGDTASADFVSDIIVDNDTLQQKRTFCISWEQVGTTRTYTLTTKQGSNSFEVESGLWSAVVPVLFKSGQHRLSNYSVLNYKPTQEQLEIIFADGYSLYKTQEKKYEEYSLVSINGGQHLTHEVATTTSKNFTLETSYTLHDVANTIEIVSPVSGVSKIAFDYNQNMVVSSGWSSKVFAAGHLTPRAAGDYTIKIVCVDGDIYCYINGELLEGVMENAQGFKLSGKILMASDELSRYYFKYLDLDHPENSRYWEFNQDIGDTVIDHYNGAIATLVGFPEDSGYVRGADGGIKGYQFGDIVGTVLDLAGAYTGTIFFGDGSQQAIEGSGPRFISEGLVHHITATDTLGTLYWDFTSGDPIKILETQDNKHATIINDSTYKWQPRIPVDVSTVGANRDYTSLSSWFIATNNGTSHKEAIIYDMLDEAVFLGSVNYRSLGFTVRAPKDLYPIGHTAKVGITGQINIVTNVNSNNFLVGIGLKSTIIGGNLLKADNCVFRAENTDAVGCSANLNLVNNCYILGANDGVFGADSNDYSRTIITNTIIDGSTRFGNVYATPINVIYRNSVNSDNFAGAEASNCVTTKASLPGKDSIVNAQSDWFNSDGTISAVGQVALAGKGFNGSNIAEWAYYEDPVTGEIVEVSTSESAGGSSNLSVVPHKLLGTVTIASNGTLTVTPKKGASSSVGVTGTGAVDSTVLKLITALINQVSGGGSPTTDISVGKIVIDSVSSGGSITSLVDFIRSIVVSGSAGGSVDSSILVDKLIATAVSGSGDVVTLTSLIRAIIGSITGGGSDNVSVTYAKHVATHITSGGSVVTSLEELVNTITALISGGGIVASDISIGKFSSAVVTEGGELEVIVSATKFSEASGSANGDVYSSALKEVGAISKVSATGSIANSVLISKLVASSVTAEGSGLLISVTKGVYQQVGVSGQASIVSEVTTNKELGSITITQNGNTKTVYLRDFTDTNMIYISLCSLSETNNIGLTSISISNNKEITVNANTKPR